MNRVSAPCTPPSDCLLIDQLQVLLQTGLVPAWECISKLARSQCWCASLTSLDHGHQVHLQFRLGTASACISEFTQCWSPIASPNWLGGGCILHPQTRSCRALEYISEFTHSQSPIASPNMFNLSLRSHDCLFQTHLELLWSSPFS
jgi:hypothetical protein